MTTPPSIPPILHVISQTKYNRIIYNPKPMEGESHWDVIPIRTASDIPFQKIDAQRCHEVASKVFERVAAKDPINVADFKSGVEVEFRRRSFAPNHTTTRIHPNQESQRDNSPFKAIVSVVALLAVASKFFSFIKRD